MPDHRYLDVLRAVETRLQGASGIDAARVDRGRSNALRLDGSPHYGVYLGVDTPLGEFGPQNLSVIDWSLSIVVEIAIQVSTAADLDATLLECRALVHEALMADESQGTDFILMTVPQGADEPVIDGEGEQRIAVYRTQWGFRVRTAVGQMTG